MLRPLIFLLASVLRADSQTSGVPQGGGACVTEDDCSLGGVCESSKCKCDAWFTGATCALLNLQAPVDTRGGTCGPAFDNYHSWGGRTIYDAADKQFHAYISFLCKHNNLGAWTTQSASAHFTTDSPAGEYTWGAEQCTADGICTPSIIPWSHNTVALSDVSFPSDARFQIFHVGDGIVPPAQWSPCWNASEAGPGWTPPTAPRALDATGWSVGAPASTSAPNPGNTAYVTSAPASDGPWTRELDNAGVPINFTGSWTDALAGNPAPLVMPDGSVNLYFTATPCPPNSGAKASNCIAVATSTTGSLGPYQMRAARHPITYPESEDPSVFRDPRGNYHLLTNVNTCHARCAQGIECGGHAWSRDGFIFSNLTIGAFGPYITFANGTSWANAYVERPLVTQSADGTPLAFYVGMGRTGYGDCCNWPQLFCTGAAGEICGPTITPPPPPPPPAVKLQNGGLCLTFNASTFPCSGSGAAAGCPVVMGDCASTGAKWVLDGGYISSAVVAGTALDVDCDTAVAHTLVKVLKSGPSKLALDASRGVIAFNDGAFCLNTGQGPARPPCGPPGEKWLPTQIQLIPCADPSAAGWTAVPL